MKGCLPCGCLSRRKSGMTTQTIDHSQNRILNRNNWKFNRYILLKTSNFYFYYCKATDFSSIFFPFSPEIPTQSMIKWFLQILSVRSVVSINKKKKANIIGSWSLEEFSVATLGTDKNYLLKFLVLLGINRLLINFNSLYEVQHNVPLYNEHNLCQNNVSWN